MQDEITKSFIDELQNEVNQNGVERSILSVKSANQWLMEAQLKPKPRSLFLSLWHENEVCILYGDTGLGKTILAVQIGIEISQSQKVLYLDFELSDKQFEERYSENFTNHFHFPDNFYRAEINPDEADYIEAGFDSSEDYINFSIEAALRKTGARILIVDNLTYLRHETERAKEALPLMKNLKELKSKFDLSILALAHTPKRDLSKPITRNDLQGSKMLINFCDSAFAVGESALDKRFRYLKQIKSRSSELIYDAENILLYEVAKDGNRIVFNSVQGFQPRFEHEHLKQRSVEDRDALIKKVSDLNKAGKSQREISRLLSISLGSVNNYLKCSNGQYNTTEQLNTVNT